MDPITLQDTDSITLEFTDSQKLSEWFDQNFQKIQDNPVYNSYKFHIRLQKNTITLPLALYNPEKSKRGRKPKGDIDNANN